jgi:hypothetical protein
MERLEGRPELAPTGTEVPHEPRNVASTLDLAVAELANLHEQFVQSPAHPLYSVL